MQKKDLFPSTALTVAGPTNGEPFNIQAKARKLIGHISASAVDGATTIIAKIQHSPDKVNWYDYMTFMGIVGAAGTEARYPVTTDQAVLPYLRAQVALSGAATIATVAIDLWFENVG
jgi:hypothetical protein